MRQPARSRALELVSRTRLRRVRIVLEAVPNVSEGRDRAVVDAIDRAFATGATVLDVHSDPDHHRSVFTLVGDRRRSSMRSSQESRDAVERIDLRAHEGVHPRVGVADVVPLVPLWSPRMPRARLGARQVAARIGSELGLPVFLYGEIGDGRRPAFFRRGGLDELARRGRGGRARAGRGPRGRSTRGRASSSSARDSRSSRTTSSSRPTTSRSRAGRGRPRESSGGMPGVQAIGLLLPSSARVQV